MSRRVSSLTTAVLVMVIVLFTSAAVNGASPSSLVARYGFEARASLANEGSLSGSIPVRGEFSLGLKRFSNGAVRQVTAKLDKLAVQGPDGSMSNLDDLVGKQLALKFDREGRLKSISPALPGLDVKKLGSAKSGLEIRYRSGEKSTLAEQFRETPSGTKVAIKVSIPRTAYEEGAKNEISEISLELEFAGLSPTGDEAEINFKMSIDGGGSRVVGAEKEVEAPGAQVTAKVTGNMKFELQHGFLSSLNLESVLSSAVQSSAPNDVGFTLSLKLVELTEVANDRASDDT